MNNPTTLTEEQKQILTDHNFGDGDFEGNPAILTDLIGGGHLDLSAYKWNEEELKKAMKEIIERQQVFTELYAGVNRGSSSASSGKLRHRTLDILRTHDIFVKFLDDTKGRYGGIWKEDGSLAEGEKVMIRKLWVSKALPEEENKGKEKAGNFENHFDNYGPISKVRLIASIFGSPVGDGKMMGFCDNFEEDSKVLFSIPHGTVVTMGKVASGADVLRRYSHFVTGAAGTYVIGMELGIGKKTEIDCLHCEA
eukprot:CAMPEP_0172307328 /NCGR_PEP_ID=MMETSP1058-20130122/8217_1 /TAXON_ID=83371 /ORGANISM="Detonula confervacea, Strain CCMP 353" /LENGTH=251 /DNA_ID=CAMNT_0013019475 /DNA_START=1 /DNA_END=756 /DNA_ORIENTATION=+